MEEVVEETKEDKPEESEATDDDDDVIVEDVDESKPEEEKKAEIKMKTVIVDEWLHLNSNPPIWVRYVFLYGLMYIY